MAVSARCDVDVGQGVSRADLRKMQADLGRQKVSCQHLTGILPSSTSFAVSEAKIVCDCVFMSLCCYH